MYNKLKRERIFCHKSDGDQEFSYGWSVVVAGKD